MTASWAQALLYSNLAAHVLLVTPFAEEPWLEAQHGEAHVSYRSKAPRLL